MKNKLTKGDLVKRIDQKALKYIKNISKTSNGVKIVKPLVGLKRPLVVPK
jgi:hypothetical protein